MRSTTLLGIASLVTSLSVAQAVGAQGRASTAPPDSARVIANLFPRLFADIKLTADQEARAKSLVWTTMKAQVSVSQERDGYDKIRALQATRDSALASMLTNDADRAKFETNAAKMRPQPVDKP